MPAGVSHGFVARGDTRPLNDFVPGRDAEDAFREPFAIVHRARQGRLAALLDVVMVADERPLGEPAANAPHFGDGSPRSSRHARSTSSPAQQ